MSVINSCYNYVCSFFVPESEQVDLDLMQEVPPFGAAGWSQHLGLSMTHKPLPFDLQKLLDSDCPFWPGKKVKESHFAILVPAGIVGALAEKRYSTHFNSNCSEVTDSYWILIAKQVVPGTEHMPFAEQTKAIGDNYSPPSVVEATLAVLAAKFSDQKALYKNMQPKFTKCSDKDGLYYLVVSADPYTNVSVSRDLPERSGLTGVIRSQRTSS